MRIFLLISLYFTSLTVSSQNCTAKFWTISSSKEIREWCFDNQIVSGGDVILMTPSSSLTSFTYCSDGNINTFFAYGGSNNVRKYDGVSQWLTIPIGVSGSDNGGYGIDQYFRDSNYNLYYYDGTTVSLIATNFYMHVADIAVDSQGRAWVFTSTVQSNNTVDHLKVYDKNGLITSYPINFDSLNAYGSFFINDKLYFIKGQYASLNKNSIIPVTIVNGNVQLGTPISFPDYGFADAASANMPYLSVPDFKHKELIDIYPNPTTALINIKSDIKINEVRIYDLTGRLIKSVAAENTINIADLANQVYILKIESDNGTFTKIIEKK